MRVSREHGVYVKGSSGKCVKTVGMLHMGGFVICSENSSSHHKPNSQTFSKVLWPFHNPQESWQRRFQLNLLETSNVYQVLHGSISKNKLGETDQ